MRRWGSVWLCVTFLVALPAWTGSHVVAKKAALSSASRYATNIGLNVLRDGGNAADAAVAVGIALAVCHPQAGNLGGGGVLVYYDRETDSVWTLDFLATPPAEFRREAESAGIAAGVKIPGTVAGYQALHERFGSLPWKQLVAPAILLASEGFTPDTTLIAALRHDREERQLDQMPETTPYFPGGELPQNDARIVQPALARTLESLQGGDRSFYHGDIAKRIVKTSSENGGRISMRDLESYEPEWRAPFRIDFLGRSIFTVPPPSAGGLIIGQALNILSAWDLATFPRFSKEILHVAMEAERRAYLEGDHQLAGRAQSRLALEEIFSASRGDRWRSTIRNDQASASLPLARDLRRGESTTHYSITDTHGNMIAVTTSLGREFGSGLVVSDAGFFLNDGDPVPPPTEDEIVESTVMKLRLHPSRMMTPMIVMRDGHPLLAIGTKGGDAIPAILLQILLDVTIHGTGLVDAIEAPRFVQTAFPDSIYYESGRADRQIVERLNLMGHGTIGRDDFGDVHAVMINQDGITAVADSRGDGAAGGY